MPRYQAECYFADSKIGRQKMEISAATRQGAIDQFKKVYGARQVSDVREVKPETNNTSSSVDTSGAAGLAVLAVLAWAFVSFAPWVLMFVGGSAAAWLGTKITGLDLEDTSNSDPNATIKGLIVFVLMLSAGFFGFYKGTELQKWINTPDTPAQQQIKK
jgi:hypothetical protein